jgi:predicted RNase H-like nuclease (RuvC/YqgF family)
MEVLPVLVGGGGLLGLGGLVATLYLLRAQRDDTIARAARALVEGAEGYNEDLREDLADCRRQVREQKDHNRELTREMAVMHRETIRLRSERDRARAERDAALFRLGEPPATAKEIQ